MRYSIKYTNPITGERLSIRIDEENPRVTVGRHSSNTITIPHESLARRHAKFQIQLSNGKIRVSNYAQAGCFVGDEKLGRMATSKAFTVKMGEIEFEVAPLGVELPEPAEPLLDSAVTGAFDKGDYIGTVQKHPTGVLLLELSSGSWSGKLSEKCKVFSPGDRGYDELVEHVGGLKFNETKNVRPWPFLEEL